MLELEWDLWIVIGLLDYGLNVDVLYEVKAKMLSTGQSTPKSDYYDICA